ncbi:translation initiation factor 2 subunit beta [Candidatus Methanoplasma termitum]|uniref:Translation initiation factor 2 subunit beta n=1 Tax=Candidatus Methanoplasma termitum TaxID=1577791 RepID=A0A0A7LCK0_9ARCH|nr:translation initiation factor IF-2 subunit beta [Candidatus Methanoplasma termitum]AIZ56905.1 translation initiation factor 2 subunit beta [Candidatus Methanoplasma termitum]MCL2333436.1 translation initiation factor IF-2 subunit beta [Candidatus Methanoplasma sp.]
MADDDYMALLDRAKEVLPETIENHERFELPELDILQEGKITVFRNFIDVTDKLRRDPQHLLQFLLRDLGTPGNVEGRRAIFKAKISPSSINEKIGIYTETYVICSECGLPDTKIVKEDRTLILECEACGARRSINVRKAAKTDAQKVLRVGDTIEILISDVGKKGDGVGKHLDYIVVVPGTAKGNTVNAKITNISGKTAFGTVVQTPAAK